MTDPGERDQRPWRRRRAERHRGDVPARPAHRHGEPLRPDPAAARPRHPDPHADAGLQLGQRQRPVRAGLVAGRAPDQPAHRPAASRVYDDTIDVFVLSGAEELAPVPLGAAAPGDLRTARASPATGRAPNPASPASCTSPAPATTTGTCGHATGCAAATAPRRRRRPDHRLAGPRGDHPARRRDLQLAHHPHERQLRQPHRLRVP